ncbi:MAG TPA: S53 family peptidase [Blastocatellia bacterium]|nr:S53 family peptidase [Blastocatellia bacterium]
MNRRSYTRFFLLLIAGIGLTLSAAFIARVDASGAQGPETEKAAQKRNVGEVPRLAKQENFAAYMSADEQVRMLLTLEPRHQAALDKLMVDLYDPASSLYHQWLTPEEYGRRFGRTQGEFSSAVSWLKEQGFSVDREYSNHTVIGFTGSVDTVQRAFQVLMARYCDESENRFFYSNTVPPTLPASIDRITIGLTGLNDAVLYKVPAHNGLTKSPGSQDQRIRPDGQISGSKYIFPQDLALLYDYQPLWSNNIKGAGQKVGIIIDSDMLDSDMNAYRTATGLPATTVQRIVFSGLTNPGRTFDEVETDVDTQAISATAPAAEIDLVLVATLSGTNVETAQQDILNQNTIKIVNESFGNCESLNFSTTQQNTFNQAVTQGTAFFAAAGDDSTNCNASLPTTQGISCPACYAGVTSVGGTTLLANYDVSDNVTSRASEVVWNTPPGVQADCSGSAIIPPAGTAPPAGTGGGVSAQVAMPAYQTNSQGFPAGVPSGTKRYIPDIAAIANPGGNGSAIVGVLLVTGGVAEFGGGTSLSSPLIAGMMALVNQSKGSPQGSPNTVLYQLGVNQYQNGGPQAYVDITSGNNNIGPLSPCLPSGRTGFSAKTGYDAVAGWGVPDLNVIANNFTNYVGFVDVSGCTSMGGWAADRNRLNQSINIEIYDGTNLIAVVPAFRPRPDVASFLGDNGLHGYTLPTQATLLNGASHTVHIKFENSTTEVSGSPFTINCATETPNYIGFIDALNCTRIAGWAADKNRLNQPISVSIYDGTTLIVTLRAGQVRNDVGAFLGDNGLHGYSTPTPASLMTGTAHSIHVKFETGPTELTSSPQSLTCP